MTRPNRFKSSTACLLALVASTPIAGCAAPGRRAVPAIRSALRRGSLPVTRGHHDDEADRPFGDTPGGPERFRQSRHKPFTDQAVLERVARTPTADESPAFPDQVRLTGAESDNAPRDPALARVSDAWETPPGLIVAALPEKPTPEVVPETETPDAPDEPPLFDKPPVKRPRPKAPAASSEGDGTAFPDGVRISQAPDDHPPRRPAAPDDDDDDDEDDDDDKDQEDTNLNRSRAGRRGEGGGPTRAEEDEDEENEEDEFKSDLLIKALGLQDSPISVFGWLQGSYTGNQFHPRNGENFGVEPNTKANAWLFQQLYFVVEKRLDPKKSDEYGFGFRVDTLTGSDWRQFKMVGLFDGAFSASTFGYEPVQFYGEVHLPWLTEGGVDVKGGRFFSLVGYEDALAPGRPLNSTSYLFSFAQPFTHFGVMTTWHVTDRLNLYNGAVNGWDRWINQNYRWGYAGGLVWDSPDGRTNVSLTFNFGPNQFPWFFKAGYQDAPNGVAQPPFLAGRRNVLYGGDNALLFSEVVIHEATDELTLVLESDQGFEPNVPSFGPGGTPANAEWYGLAGFALYEFSDRLTAVLRGEVFRDVNGVRTGYNDTYFETTLGLIIKPRPWLWFRPEVRWDWANGEPVYNDEKSNHQFTYGFDMIFLF